MNSSSTILIVDDDKRNIFALTAVLKAKRFSVVSTTSAKEAIAMLQTDKGIRIVLMDIMMPDMDGYEAIAEIRQHKELQHVKIIAVTAQAMVGDREKCLQAGAEGYVSKPINVDVLLEMLQEKN